MKRALFFNGCVIFLIILFAISPLIFVSIAAFIADANGCQLDEGSVHPCIVNGSDMGETLYAMGMLGWFGIATLPLGLAALVLYLLGVAIFYFIRYLRRRKSPLINTP